MRLLPEPVEPGDYPCYDCGATGVLIEPGPAPSLYGQEHPCPTCRGFGTV